MFARMNAMSVLLWMNVGRFLILASTMFVLVDAGRESPRGRHISTQVPRHLLLRRGIFAPLAGFGEADGNGLRLLLWG